MKLAKRLSLGVLAAALPVAVLATAWELRHERERALDDVRVRAVARFEFVGRELCEAAPQEFPYASPATDAVDDWLSDAPAEAPERRDARVRYFVYDAELAPARGDAPAIPPRIARRFRAGESSVSWVARRANPRAVRRGRARLEHTLVRAPFASARCAAVLVERPLPPPRGLFARVLPALSVTLAVLLAVIGVVGPVARRLRRLIEAVNAGRVGELDRGGGDEVAELGEAFRTREATIAAQLESLAAREAALREHLAATSHDVLLPITVLQGHLLEIESKAARGEPPDALSVRGALEETHYVVALVRDLNAEARLRTGLVVKDAEVDLVALVERVIARHRPIATRAGIALESATPEAPLVVRGDPTLLEQMVSNVVHNAVRYGESGGHVAVVLEPRPDGFRLEVSDDGPGVDAAALAQLGARGFRTDEARTRRPEGMGLGLHIVREVAAMHGYALVFADAPPHGLSVTISAPFTPSAERARGGDPLLASGRSR